MNRTLPLMLCALLTGLPASAVVLGSGQGGFVVREEVVYPGNAAAAWQRLVRPQDWWDPEHTYSHDSKNLSLVLKVGGCWCERLANGGAVRHLEVVYVSPRETLRLTGGLGPLQRMGANGTLSFMLKREPSGGTRVVAEYAVSGFAPAGFTDMAGAVDEVLGAQLARYAKAP